MVVVGATAVAVGVALGVLILRSLDSGETWEDWQDVKTPSWWTPLTVLLVASLVVGVAFEGLPGELRLVLAGVPAGICLTAFTIGIRRWRVRGMTEPEAEWEPESEPEPRPLWRRVAVTVLWAVPLSVAVGLILGFRDIGDFVAVSVLGTFAVFVHDAADRWTDRRWR